MTKPRTEKMRDLEGAKVVSVEFVDGWCRLHLAFRGTDDGAAIVQVPIDGYGLRGSGIHFADEDET